MRIFFDFNRKKQTLLCHEMAKYWKEKYGIKDYAGMVVVKDDDHFDFLKNQNEIDYDFIINRDEVESSALERKLDLKKIRKIENELGIPLWYLVVADRNIGHFFVEGGVVPKTKIMDKASHENIMKYIVHHYEVFEKKLDEFRPDAVVLFALASLPSLLFIKICEKKNIPYHILKSSRIKSYYSILSCNYEEIDPRVVNSYKEIINSKKPSKKISSFAIKYLKSFRNKPKLPLYAEFTKRKVKNSTRNFEKDLLFSGFKFGMRSLLSFFVLFTGKINKSYLRKIKPSSYLYVHIRKNLISKYLSSFIFRDKINLKEKYVFFPLHLDPEASTMVLSPNFVNQLSVIESLAKNIPIDHKLYVKEHVPCLGSRPKNFYDKIKKYPNVKLISPWENNFDIIKNASLVAVISGTAGWEGILFNKPVITFSETIYTKVGLGKYCPNFDILGNEIMNSIYGDRKTVFGERDVRIKALLTAIHQNSFEADADNLVWGDYMNSEDKKNRQAQIKKIAEEFYKTFKNNRK